LQQLAICQEPDLPSSNRQMTRMAIALPHLVLETSRNGRVSSGDDFICWILGN